MKGELVLVALALALPAGTREYAGLVKPDPGDRTALPSRGVR